jgi:hypothetical protein
MTPDHAKQIMGSNFFGVEEAVKCFGVQPSGTHLFVTSELPFSEGTLLACKNTHVLVAVFPLSIVEIRTKVDSRLFYNQSWYKKEMFALEKGQVNWQLVRKTPLDNSIFKTWEEQMSLVGEDTELPSAHVLTYAVIGTFLADRGLRGMPWACMYRRTVTYARNGPVMDQDHREVQLSLEQAEVGQQPGHFAGVVLVDAVQSHQRVQEQQPGPQAFGRFQ